MNHLNPTSKHEFVIRPFHMETDVERLLALRVAIEAVDQVGTNTSAAALQAEFQWHGHQPEKDRWVAEAVDPPYLFLGHAWVFHQTGRRSILHAAVHPSWRNRGLGGELLKKVIGRAVAMGAAQIVAGAEKKNIVGDAFLRAKGFRPVGQNRHLAAPAHLRLERPQWPAGFYVRTYAELGEVSAVVEACNACYADMWGHGQNTELSTVASYAEFMNKYPDHFFPAGMFVLFSPDDEVAGVCFGRIEETEDDTPLKVIDSPGLIPPLRHLNLQRQLVLTTMSWLNTMADGDFHLFSWGDTEEATAIYQDLGFILNAKDHTIEYLLQRGDAENNIVGLTRHKSGQ